MGRLMATHGYQVRYRPGHPRATASGDVYEHVLVAEAALGHFLPPLAEVHHVDENRKNNRNRNLVICQDKGYHKLLHFRTRILRAGGNPNTQKLCSFCRTFKALEEFDRMAANKSTGRQSACRSCCQARNRGRRRPGRAA